jgi:alpha-L-fucosidase
MKSLIILVLLHVMPLFAGMAQPFQIIVNTEKEPIAPGKFLPTWESLQQYQIPEWFRDAKFGIWAHWGPQCQPEQGDWYARFMYSEGHANYRFHNTRYGHPSEFGFKDIILSWKAEKWDPEALVKLYKRTGAQYFFAMANHHDNLDMWDSKYQPWNSVKTGPGEDIVAGWARAAKKYGLPFGLSVHASHAWIWYETAQGSDKTGPKAGVPYDGLLTKADGKGTWWEGLDPQELYAQNHPRSSGAESVNTIHQQWGWENGAVLPSQEYTDKFYNRTIDLINKFQPDLLYFDDTALPLYPFSDAGLKIAAHFYNANLSRNKGKLSAVLFGKMLSEEQKQCLVWDIERGAPENAQKYAWQTCSCLGNWHYDESVYNRNRYKTAKTVIHMLIDIVSKNGNLLLNVPVRGDGSIDDKEMAILNEIAQWMDSNKESIIGTRPWILFGEGPALVNVAPLTAQGFNEGKNQFSANDIRYNAKGNTLYATTMGIPTEQVQLKACSKKSGNIPNPVIRIELLGSKEPVQWFWNDGALTINPPKNAPNNIALVYKITF